MRIKNPLVIVFAIPMYIFKFVCAIIATIVLSFGMAWGMLFQETDGSVSKNAIDDVWDWFRQGVFCAK